MGVARSPARRVLRGRRPMRRGREASTLRPARQPPAAGAATSGGAVAGLRGDLGASGQHHRRPMPEGLGDGGGGEVEEPEGQRAMRLLDPQPAAREVERRHHLRGHAEPRDGQQDRDEGPGQVEHHRGPPVRRRGQRFSSPFGGWPISTTEDAVGGQAPEADQRPQLIADERDAADEQRVEPGECDQRERAPPARARPQRHGPHDRGGVDDDELQHHEQQQVAHGAGQRRAGRDPDQEE